MNSEFIKRGISVLVTGPSGVGKSHIISAYGNQACMKMNKVMYYNMQKLLEVLQMARVDGTIVKLYEKMADIDLLIWNEGTGCEAAA